MKPARFLTGLYCIYAHTWKCTFSPVQYVQVRAGDNESSLFIMQRINWLIGRTNNATERTAALYLTHALSKPTLVK